VLKTLSKCLLRNADIIDEVMLLWNPKEEEDEEYIRSLAHSEMFKIYELPEGEPFQRPVQWNTGKFYQYMTDEKTIYIRFDDDIVYLEKDFFKNLLDFRIDHPEYFLVFANIWNNAIISHYQQKEGNIGKDYGTVEKYCMDNIGWASADFAIYIHNILLTHVELGSEKDLYLKENYELGPDDRFSISCFAFFGKDFKEFEGILEVKDGDYYPNADTYLKENIKKALDEEIWLTATYPKRTGKLNVICGSALCSHLTFSPHQKLSVLISDIPERYEKIARESLSGDYYKFLDLKK